MLALIINLAAAADRLALQMAQLKQLALPFERIEAVTPATLSPPADDPMWHRWQRPLRATEMALLASHVRAWQRVMRLARPALVLEDDALLAASVPAFLETVAALAGIDHITLETRGRKKLVARDRDPRAAMRRLWQDRTGSAAYVVWPSGAAKLLRAANAHAGPSDAVISSAGGLVSYQADPALAIQLDQCAAYGVKQLLATASSVDAVPKPQAVSEAYSIHARVAFRARRVAAQVRMGWRQARHPFAVERRPIQPAADWPDLRLLPVSAPAALR